MSAPHVLQPFTGVVFIPTAPFRGGGVLTINNALYAAATGLERSGATGMVTAAAVAARFSFVGIRPAANRALRILGQLAENLTGAAVGPVSLVYLLDPGLVALPDTAAIPELDGTPVGPGPAVPVLRSTYITGTLAALAGTVRLDLPAPVTIAANSRTVGTVTSGLTFPAGVLVGYVCETVNQALSAMFQVGEVPMVPYTPQPE